MNIKDIYYRWHSGDNRFLRKFRVKSKMAIGEGKICGQRKIRKEGSGVGRNNNNKKVNIKWVERNKNKKE